MNPTRSYLWKEWREQRAAALALLLLLPVLVLSLAYSVSARIAGSTVFVSCMALLGLVVALVAIGGELLGRERRSGSQWLERLPAGLPEAFRAKLTLCAVSSVAALGYGLALGALAAVLRGKPAAGLTTELLDVTLTGSFVLDALVIALWVFAASAWSARGMLALLGGTLLAVALSLPGWAWREANYRPQTWEVPAAIALVVTAALASAWWGFVRSGRGAGPWASAARGIGVAVLGVLPLWSWAAYQWHVRNRIDLHSTCHLEAAWVFDDGEHALVQATTYEPRWRHPPTHTFLVDLRDAGCRQVGGLDAEVYRIWTDHQLSSEEPDGIAVGRAGDGASRLELDPRTAEMLEGVSEPGSLVSYEGEAGHGWYSYRWDGSWMFHDPFVGKAIPASRVSTDWIRVSIGPEGWLVWTFDGWLEFSPASGEAIPAVWMDDIQTPGPRLADGRMLARSQDDTWVLVDPVEDRILPLSSPASVSTDSWPAPASGRDAFRPGEPVLINIGRERYLLDEERLELSLADASYAGCFVRCLPDGTLFFLTETGLERRDPVSGARVVVFRLADARVD